jgi:hypothetical protein
MPVPLSMMLMIVTTMMMSASRRHCEWHSGGSAFESWPRTVNLDLCLTWFLSRLHALVYRLNIVARMRGDDYKTGIGLTTGFINQLPAI